VARILEGNDVRGSEIESYDLGRDVLDQAVEIIVVDCWR
jgi:hypothetical protein